jgi:hypothetical protein
MAINAGHPTRSIQFTGSTIIIGGDGHSAGAAAPVGADASRRSSDSPAEHWDLTGPVARWPAQVRSLRPPPDDRPARPVVQDPVGRHRLGEVGPRRRNLRARILTEAILGREHE